MKKGNMFIHITAGGHTFQDISVDEIIMSYEPIQNKETISSEYINYPCLLYTSISSIPDIISINKELSDALYFIFS